MVEEEATPAEHPEELSELSVDELVELLKEKPELFEKIKEVLKEEGVSVIEIRTRISNNLRAAMWRLKRAFYASISNEKADLKKSQEKWAEFARRFVDWANSVEEEARLSQRPCSILLKCVKEGDALKPVHATVTFYEKAGELEFKA